jgi:regulator of sirC expression with transglutaminase-like and TPR domain
MIPKSRSEAENAIKACAAMPPERFDLTACALACALHEDPDRDVSDALAVLDRLTALALSRQPQSALALSQLIYGELGFAGAAIPYDDPQNADLISILSVRKGLPVGLSVIWRHVARLSNAPLSGVDSPGHFLLRLESGDGPIFLDPLAGGAILDQDGLTGLASRMGVDQLTPHMLAPVRDRVLAIRLQTNLASRAKAGGQTEAWLRAAHRRALLAPDHPGILLDASAAAEAAGQIRVALEWAQRASHLQGANADSQSRLLSLRNKLN